MASGLMKLAASLARPIYGGAGTILLFHRICPDRPGRLPENAALEMAPEELEALLETLPGHGYDFISLDEIPGRLANPIRGRRFIAFTFDDGYADVYHHALPIFQRHGMPFTVYLISRFPDRLVQMWWYWTEILFNQVASIRLETPAGEVEFDLAGAEGRRAAALEIRHQVKFAPPGVQEAALERIFGKHIPDLVEKTAGLPLTWEQVQALAQEPLVTIGSHTANHYVLNRLSEVQARQEMAEAKGTIEARIGREVRHFSYPYGSHNEAGDREIRLAGELGFSSAVTTRIANVFPEHRNHILSLPRLDACRSRGVENLLLALAGLTSLRPNRFRRVVTD